MNMGNIKLNNKYMQQEQIEQAQQQSKQNTIIRKTAIQTFQPIVTKMQQHIAYLLAQTTRLRQKNEVLQKTVMDHRIINQSMAELREDMHRINMRVTEAGSKEEMERVTIKTEIIGLNVQIEKLKDDLKNKEIKIQELFGKNAEQSARLETSALSFKQIVQDYATKVSNLQISNKKLKLQLQATTQNFQTSTSSLSQTLQKTTVETQQNTNKLELYLSQRKQLNELIHSIWSKVDRAVDLGKYEADWRIIRMENQQMRADNRKMIDQALTPDVREFLPEMMQRITQVRKVNVLEKLFYQQKTKQENFQLQQAQSLSVIRQQLQKISKRAQTIRSELKSETTKITKQMSEKFQQGNDTAATALTNVQQQTAKLIAQKQQNLTNKIQTLLDRNRANIYEIVVGLIPQEEKDYFYKMKQFMPLLESTKVQILNRCDQITAFGKSLEERLEGFNNRIVKIKGDMNVDIDNLKKKNKSIDNSILIIADNFKSIGKIISLYCELFLLDFSLSFDPIGQEIYVTYNDGIVYESCPVENQINYRKTKATRDQFRRSALANLIKLTDEIIISEEYHFMYIAERKPSSHFKSIREGVMITPPTLPAKKKQRKFSAKGRQGSLDSKLPSIDYNPFKTVDFTSTNLPEAPNKQIGIHTITSDLSNIRKKDKERSSYRGRYSQMK